MAAAAAALSVELSDFPSSASAVGNSVVVVVDAVVVLVIDVAAVVDVDTLRKGCTAPLCDTSTRKSTADTSSGHRLPLFMVNVLFVGELRFVISCCQIIYRSRYCDERSDKMLVFRNKL